MNEYLASQRARNELLGLYDAQGIQSSRSPSSLLKVNLPKSLFKYCGISEYSINNLKNNEITVTQPSEFNDIYDSTMHVDNKRSTLEVHDQFEKMWKKLGYKEQVLSDETKKLHLKDAEKKDRHYLNYLTNDFYIDSFTSDKKNILMWSHYANCNRGICIEYDFTKWIAPIKKNIFPVTYIDQPVDLTDLCEPIENDKISLAMLSAVASKFEEWSYEKEWRLVYYFYNCKDKRIQLKQVPTPKTIYLGSKFIENYHYVKTNKDCVNKYNLLEKILIYAEDHQIPLFIARREVRNFKLVYLPVSTKDIRKRASIHKY